MSGVVYVLINPLMPGLCKIGMTSNDIEARMKQLFTSGVPVPFECHVAVEVPDAAKTEKLLHDAFGDHRLSSNREFFRIDPERVRAALMLAGGTDVTPKGDVADDPADVEALSEAKKSKKPFKFSMIGAAVGDEIVSTFDKNIVATIHDDSSILFRDKVTSLSASALEIAHEHGFEWKAIQGTLRWKWHDKTLDEWRRKVEEGEEVD